MSTSLKRHPSGELDESPEPKRATTEQTKLSSPQSSENKSTDEQTTPVRSGSDAVRSAPDTADTADVPSFLLPPTKVGGYSITDKVKITDGNTNVNGKSDTILNSGFKLSTGASLFSNGVSEENGTNIYSNTTSNIFSTALRNVGGTGGGIFGSSTAGSGSFVFGANLTDRVISPPVKSSDKSEAESPAESKEEEAAAPGTSPEDTNTDPAKPDKPTFVEAKVTSGEEDEKRLLQTSCKLYQFCAEQKVWLDRGAGTLRINEKVHANRTSSRLVVRSKAVMKVMLNTKIFADMFINRANLTTIRLSALDNGKLGTFLLKCTRNECDRLHSLLLKRREIDRSNDEDDTPQAVPEDQAESSKSALDTMKSSEKLEDSGPEEASEKGEEVKEEDNGESDVKSAVKTDVDSEPGDPEKIDEAVSEAPPLEETGVS